MALTAAKKLLLKRGPDGVTLKAVADELGMSHTNLIHHFGSAEALQSALMGAMVHDLTDAIQSAVVHVRADENATRALIDIVFDAFDKGGAGQLAAWIALSNKHAHLEPVREAVQSLVKAINDRVTKDGAAPPKHTDSALLFVTLCAFGDAVIGERLRAMLGRDRDAVRRIATFLLPSFF
ncbi:MAG TPA: TetR/AcrR family transcriptional regulator [Rhizomicrobium sp.]|nr:TetR/AcrR family transcriptional regulator [Rhizomicrobium sp.]